MSLLSATGFLETTQADAYTTALFDLLGDQDPLVVLGATPEALRNEIGRFPPAAIGTPEAPGKWSAAMVIAHLADSELVGAFRLRMIMAHDRPALAPYDQDLWATRLDYQHAQLDESLERFAVLRRANLSLWGTTSAEALSRVGLHAERGEESVERMRRLYAGHDLAHLRQLARIRNTVAPGAHSV